MNESCFELSSEPTKVTKIPELPIEKNSSRRDMRSIKQHVAAETPNKTWSNGMDKHIVLTSTRWKRPEQGLTQWIQASNLKREGFKRQNETLEHTAHRPRTNIFTSTSSREPSTRPTMNTDDDWIIQHPRKPPDSTDSHSDVDQFQKHAKPSTARRPRTTNVDSIASREPRARPMMDTDDDWTIQHPCKPPDSTHSHSDIVRNQKHTKLAPPPV